MHGLCGACVRGWWRQPILVVHAGILELRWHEMSGPPSLKLWFRINKMYHTTRLGAKREYLVGKAHVIASLYIRVRWMEIEDWNSWVSLVGEWGYLPRLRWHLLHLNSVNTLTSSSVLMRPPWVSLFLYKLVSSPLLIIKGGTSACNLVNFSWSIVNKRLWRQFLCGIYGCLDRAHSTFVR